MTASNRTGGPRTEEGKAIASKNALKTGAYSKAIVLPGEEESEFLELQKQLAEEFQVVGLLEQTLIADLAASIWKQLRLKQIEKNYLLTQLERRPTPSELREVGLNLPDAADLMWNNPNMANHLKAVADRRFKSTLETLLSSEIMVQTLFETREMDTMLFEWLLSYAERSGLLVKTEFMRRAIAQALFGDTKSPHLNQLASGIAEAAAAILWIIKNKEAIDEAREKVKDLRLLNFMQQEGVKRAQDDLSRGFYRTLSELRKQIEWRQKNSPIDVTPA